MNTTMLATAAFLLLVLATSAQAVHLDPGGRGQVLIYPYYTVNKHQQTLLSVTNTSSVAQAVGIRFLEGHNGRQVMGISIYLSPFDSWTGTAFALRDNGIDRDGAAILSADTSCAEYQLSTQGSINAVPYFEFDPLQFALPNDGGPYTMDRTHEGYIEVYAMADVASPLAGLIAHGSNGEPPTGCAQAQYAAPDNAAFSTPTGGLIGALSIIDVAQGTYLSIRAEALAGFTGRHFGGASPDFGLPTMAAVNDGVDSSANRATARIHDASGKMQILTFPGPDARSRRVDAVSAVLMADRVYNEFQISSALGAASDWLLTFPTKHFYVDQRYTSSQGRPAIPPFTTVYNGRQAGYSPSRFLSTYYSRNGKSGGGCALFGGQVCGLPFYLDYTTNVLAVHPSLEDNRSEVLGSALRYRWTHQVQTFLSPSQLPTTDAGSLAVDFGRQFPAHQLLPSVEGKVLRGLPVIGFWASNVVNNNVGNGVLANYAAAVRHATSVTCVKASDGTPCD